MLTGKDYERWKAEARRAAWANGVVASDVARLRAFLQSALAQLDAHDVREPAHNAIAKAVQAVVGYEVKPDNYEIAIADLRRIGREHAAMKVALHSIVQFATEAEDASDGLGGCRDVAEAVLRGVR